MLKKEFIEAVAEKSGASKKDTNAVVAAALETIRDALAQDETLTFLGFGTFKVSKRAARNGRNPQTGETIKIKASKLPVFRASIKLKEYINQTKTKNKTKGKTKTKKK